MSRKLAVNQVTGQSLLEFHLDTLTLQHLFGFCSVTQLYLTPCSLMDGSTPGFSVLYHLLEFAQTLIH